MDDVERGHLLEHGDGRDDLGIAFVAAVQIAVVYREGSELVPLQSYYALTIQADYIFRVRRGLALDIRNPQLGQQVVQGEVCGVLEPGQPSDELVLAYLCILERCEVLKVLILFVYPEVDIALAGEDGFAMRIGFESGEGAGIAGIGDRAIGAGLRTAGIDAHLITALPAYIAIDADALADLAVVMATGTAIGLEDT